MMNQRRNNRMNLATMILPALIWTGSCATLRHDIRQRQQTSEQRTVSELEAMTAAGNFPIVAEYVNQYFRDHSDAYMNEKYALGETLVQQIPNAIYGIAIDQYAEDVHEYMDTRIYAMQQMQERGGFSFNYDLNHDE